MVDKEMLKLFIKNDWKVIRIKGSHHHLKKGEMHETIAVHGKDMNPHLAKKIIEKYGLK